MLLQADQSGKASASAAAIRFGSAIELSQLGRAMRDERLRRQEPGLAEREIQERLKAMDQYEASTLELHVVKDVPEKTVGRLIGMALGKGIGRVNVTAWKKR